MSVTPHLHELTVKDIRRETADAVSIAFDIPAGLARDYSFEPGQYLTVEADINGEKLRRPYSISSGLDDGEIRIGVKKTPGGLISTHLNDRLKIGDRLSVMTPMGRFTVPLDAKAADNHLFIAAGSGITPILSVLKTVLAREPKSRALLIYGNRRQSDIMFLEAIEDLKDRYLERFSVHHILSREFGAIDILNGRIDGPRIEAILAHAMPAKSVSHAFLCGPGDLGNEAEATLKRLGVAGEKIHREIFSPAEGKRGAPVVVGKGEGVADLEARGEIILEGRRHFIDIRKGETIIDAAHREGVEAPYACKGGMCCTCRARLVEGAVEMETNYSLEPWEIEAGFVLTCQSHPKTKKVIIDYDAR